MKKPKKVKRLLKVQKALKKNNPLLAWRVSQETQWKP